MKGCNENVEPMEPGSLQPADVLLSCAGEGPIGKFILVLDGGCYTHSAIYTGDQVVVEATAGLGVVGRHACCQLEDHEYVHVYRPVGLSDSERDRVAKRAHEFTTDGLEYAYDELVLGALAVYLSKLPDDPRLRRIASLLLPQLAAWIEKEISKKGKTGMVCTELVCTSFFDAGRGLEIEIDGLRFTRLLVHAAFQLGTALAADDQRHPAVREAERLLQRFKPGLGQEMAGSHAVLQPLAARFEELRPEDLELAELEVPKLPRVVAGRDLPLSVISPRQLAASPSLERIGKLVMPERKDKHCPDTIDCLRKSTRPSFRKRALGFLLNGLICWMTEKIKKRFGRNGQGSG